MGNNETISQVMLPPVHDTTRYYKVNTLLGLIHVYEIDLFNNAFQIFFK